MLVLSRRVGEQLRIGDVTLTVATLSLRQVDIAMHNGNDRPIVFTLTPNEFREACYDTRVGLIRVRGNRAVLGIEHPDEVPITRL